MCYIMDKYGAEDDQMYPKDLQQRSRILERLMFDQGCLYQRIISRYNVNNFIGNDFKLNATYSSMSVIKAHNTR